MDGISFQLLLNDLSQVYSPEASAQKVLRYLHFAICQRSPQRSGACDEDLAYWRQEFVSQVLPLSPVTSARHRHALTRYENQKTTSRVPKPLATKIRALGKQSKTSSYHLYLTAMLALLERIMKIKPPWIRRRPYVWTYALASQTPAASKRMQQPASGYISRYMAEQSLVEAVCTIWSRVHMATAHSTSAEQHTMSPSTLPIAPMARHCWLSVFRRGCMSSMLPKPS